jgi:hypothetical protein
VAAIEIGASLIAAGNGPEKQELLCLIGTLFKSMICSDCEIISDDMTWARLRVEQPRYLSELDYLVSVDALRRRFGYRD